MTIHVHTLPAQTARCQAPDVPFASRIASLGWRISDWLATAADYYTAATVYERLSGFSDAELRRRGLSRATLAAEICQAFDRANP
jgi:hypothetical protein